MPIEKNIVENMVHTYPYSFSISCYCQYDPEVDKRRNEPKLMKEPANMVYAANIIEEDIVGNNPGKRFFISPIQMKHMSR